MHFVLSVVLSAALWLSFAGTPTASAEEKVLTLESGVDATLNVPDGAAKAPAVLVLHGFGSAKNEVGNMDAREAKQHAEKGIASLRILFRGFGKSDGDAAPPSTRWSAMRSRPATTLPAVVSITAEWFAKTL
jgi:pimeloyl-ACP methyl ester carboxylesterase